MRRARQLTTLATAALALCHCSAPFSSVPRTGDMADASGGAAEMNPPIIIPVVGPDAGDATTSPDDASVDASDASIDASIDGASEASKCAAPLPLDCNGVCVDPTLPAHCGSCTKLCAGPEAGEGHAICANGACAVSCDTESSTSLDCNGACVDPTNVTHCGSCTNACAGPSSSKNGHAVCLPPSGGGMPACNIRCDAKYHQCNGDCLADTDTPSVTSDPCILTEAFGVFVASTGSDFTGKGDGSRAKPYATIGHAMDKAATAGTSPVRRVYACASAGKFTAERLVVTKSRQGVNFFGGLDCSAPTNVWTYDATKKATLAPSAQGYALKIQESTGNTFEDFAFVSNAGMSAGESSIAVFVTGAQNIVFRRSDFLAGIGKDGASAMPGPARLSMVAPIGNSTIPDPATGGWIPAPPTVNPLCPTSIGGAGGCVATPLLDGAPGQPGPLNGGFRVGCLAATQGVNGQSGAQGSGAVTWAAFTAAGWAPLAGGAGDNGQVGQGGGGGAGPVADSAYPDFCAGAGGAGGCGGAGGGGGGGGGSSIAALLYASGADFEACVLRTSDAGRGGDGVLGQPGQAGGVGGFSAATGDGTTCAAPGPGGRGGSGGAGGGGAGGLSVGIVWHGASAMAPVIDGNSVPVAVSLPNAWTSGLPGMGGQSQDRFTPTLKGKDGVSQPVLQIP